MAHCALLIATFPQRAKVRSAVLRHSTCSMSAAEQTPAPSCWLHGAVSVARRLLKTRCAGLQLQELARENRPRNSSALVQERQPPPPARQELDSALAPGLGQQDAAPRPAPPKHRGTQNSVWHQVHRKAGGGSGSSQQGLVGPNIENVRVVTAPGRLVYETETK